MNQSISVFPFTLTINTNKYWLLGSPGQLLKARKDGHLFNEKEFNVSKLFLKYTSKIFLALSFMLIFFYSPFKAFPSFSFYLYLWFAKFCLTMKIKKMTNQTRNRKWRGHERTEIGDRHLSFPAQLVFPECSGHGLSHTVDGYIETIGSS